MSKTIRVSIPVVLNIEVEDELDVADVALMKKAIKEKLYRYSDSNDGSEFLANLPVDKYTYLGMFTRLHN